MAGVLIVDSDQSIREIVHLILASEGHTVFEAPDAANGLELLRTAPDRLVVLFSNRASEYRGGPFISAVAADARLANRHAYICLTATPAAIPRRSRRY